MKYGGLGTTGSKFRQQCRLLSDWLICYLSTQTLFERALPKISKTKFHVDFALLLAEEFQENFGGFSLCPPFQNGRRLLGDKALTFRRLPFSLLLARNCFPRCFLLPFVGWKHAPQQVPKEVLTACV